MCIAASSNVYRGYMLEEGGAAGMGAAACAGGAGVGVAGMVIF